METGTCDAVSENCGLGDLHPSALDFLIQWGVRASMKRRVSTTEAESGEQTTTGVGFGALFSCLLRGLTRVPGFEDGILALVIRVNFRDLALACAHMLSLEDLQRW